MNSPAAFQATYSDWKLVKTRGVIQIVFEVPLKDSDAAYDVLGGMPDFAKERWFGIAALKQGKEAMPDTQSPVQHIDARPQPNTNKPSAGAKRGWRDMPPSQQAGIRINEPTFAAYLREEHPDEWHETSDADACLKIICRIESKTELMADQRRAMLWHQLDSAYQAWLAKERVGA